MNFNKVLQNSGLALSDNSISPIMTAKEMFKKMNMKYVEYKKYIKAETKDEVRTIIFDKGEHKISILDKHSICELSENEIIAMYKQVEEMRLK